MNQLKFKLRSPDRDPSSTFRLILDEDDSVILQALDMSWTYHWGENDDCSPEDFQIRLTAEKTKYSPDDISGLVANMRGSYEVMRGRTLKGVADASSAVHLATSVLERMREE